MVEYCDVAEYKNTKYAGMSPAEKKAAYDRARFQNRRAWLARLKDHPCGDCGGRFPPIAMDFHHTNGDGARFNFRTAKKARVLEEVKKCVLLCANCHRIRHGGTSKFG